jgi:hypothetical protein
MVRCKLIALLCNDYCVQLCSACVCQVGTHRCGCCRSCTGLCTSPQALAHASPCCVLLLSAYPSALRSFDLIFVDANKDGYAGYYGAIMQHCLLAHDGLLVVDNSLMKVRGEACMLAQHSCTVQSLLLSYSQGYRNTITCRGGGVCGQQPHEGGGRLLTAQGAARAQVSCPNNRGLVDG